MQKELLNRLIKRQNKLNNIKTNQMCRVLKTYMMVVILLLHQEYTFSQNPEKVKLLLLVEASNPLVVDYQTTGSIIRHVLMSGSLTDIAITGIRQSNHSKQFREAIGEIDRNTILVNGIKSAFKTHSDFFLPP